MEQLSHGLTGLIVVATSPLPRFRFFFLFLPLSRIGNRFLRLDVDAFRENRLVSRSRDSVAAKRS